MRFDHSSPLTICSVLYTIDQHSYSNQTKSVKMVKLYMVNFSCHGRNCNYNYWEFLNDCSELQSPTVITTSVVWKHSSLALTWHLVIFVHLYRVDEVGTAGVEAPCLFRTASFENNTNYGVVRQATKMRLFLVGKECVLLFESDDSQIAERDPWNCSENNLEPRLDAGFSSASALPYAQCGFWAIHAFGLGPNDRSARSDQEKVASVVWICRETLPTAAESL